MRAVAVTALNQAFVDTVMEGPRKLRAHVHVTRVTEFRRLRLHQELAFLRVVRRVAVNAGDAVGQVHRAVIVPMLFGVLMAPQAARAGLLRGSVFEGEDLGLVTPAVDMLFTRAVTSLAAMPFHALVSVEFRVHRGGEVRGGGEVCVDALRGRSCRCPRQHRGQDRSEPRIWPRLEVLSCSCRLTCSSHPQQRRVRKRTSRRG